VGTRDRIVGEFEPTPASLRVFLENLACGKQIWRDRDQVPVMAPDPFRNRAPLGVKHSIAIIP
jgi:hypothetical protein